MLTSPQGMDPDGVRAGRGREPSRITEVDVLRGFALLGISIVNTAGISNMPTGASDPSAGYWAFETLLHQRFLPIFSFLFGVSSGLFLDAVRDRTRYPRLMMLARLGFLIPFGMLHRTLQPDEVLLTYAVVGMVVLLPASFLPVRLVAVLSFLSTLAGLVAGGGTLIIPGLFLVGLSVQRHGLRKVTDVRVSHVATAFGAAASLAVCLDVWQIAGGADTGTRVAASAGVVTAVAYVTALMLVLRTPGGSALLHRLAPAGRMALTGYISATLMIIAADHFIDLGAAPKYGTAVSVGVSVFAIELVFSRMWLRRARYGPVEWMWRCLTWWHLVPNNRSTRI